MDAACLPAGKWYLCFHVFDIIVEGRSEFVKKPCVSLRFYLADPSYDEANVKILMKYLGSHAPARTVFCCQLLEKKWKLEIEAVAVK